MVISPAVPAPKSGDPITAKWASDLSASVNSCANPADRAGEVSTPFGKASPAPGLHMLGDPSPLRLFECRVVYDATRNEYSVYCCVPSMPQEIVNYIVLVYDTTAIPSSSQPLGTPWVPVGSVSANEKWWLALCLEPPTDTDYVPAYRWRLAFITSSFPALPAWAWEQSPFLPIAFGQPGWVESPGGFIQLHTGVAMFGTPAISAFSTAAKLPLRGIGDRLGNPVAWWQDSGAVPKTYVRNLDIGAQAAFFNGAQIDSQTITDGHGNQVTVLTI